MHDTELLPATAAARAKQLELFARTRVEGFLRGDNLSKLKGSSTDFLHHRAYIPGDDIRRLDWRVFARSDRLVTREYEKHTNLNVILAVDYSGSMGYEGGAPAGSGAPQGMGKIDFVRHCAAMLAYLLNLQKDRFALAALAQHVVRFVKPAKGRRHMAEVFRELAGRSPEGQTDLAACVTQLAHRVRRKSVFVFLSDCYQDPESLAKALGSLRLAGHDVVLYQVYDPAELDLPFVGFTLFRDLETGQVDPADPLEIRAAYQDVFRQHVLALADGANRFGVEFHSLPTSPDWDVVLAKLLHARAVRS